MATLDRVLFNGRVIPRIQQLFDRTEKRSIKDALYNFLADAKQVKMTEDAGRLKIVGKQHIGMGNIAMFEISANLNAKKGEHPVSLQYWMPGNKRFIRFMKIAVHDVEHSEMFGRPSLGAERTWNALARDHMHEFAEKLRVSLRHQPYTREERERQRAYLRRRDNSEQARFDEGRDSRFTPEEMQRGKRAA